MYVWYSPSEFENATLKGESLHACKVGRTKGVVNARLIAQGIYTAFPSDPIVPLVIKTEDSRRLEDAIHAVLVYAGKQITNIRGTEWFRTNAQEIEQIYMALNQLCETIGTVHRSASTTDKS
ncbi:MAG: GIY-YIG nuclease family protein [Terracidiphilus sp.]